MALLSSLLWTVPRESSTVLGLSPKVAAEEASNEEVATAVAARLEKLRRGPAGQLAPGLAVQLGHSTSDAVVAFALATATYRLLEGAFHVQAALVFSLGFVGAFHALGGYRASEGPCRVEAVSMILKAAVLAVGALALAALARGSALGPLSLVVTGPVVALGLVAHRLVARVVETRAPGHEARKPALIYGAGSTGKLLAQKLLLEPDFGLVPVGFVDDDPALEGREIRVGPGEHGACLKVLGRRSDLERLIERHSPVAVFLAASSASAALVAELESEVESYGLPLYFVPAVGHGRLAGLRADSVDGIPVLSRRQPVEEALYAATKRLADFVGALTLLALTAPIMAVAAALVRATSDGPAIFAQRRVGLDGALFRIYKLRTMFVTAPAYGVHPERAEDARVTPIGRWLRRLSLDELPQLYNILRGEMSFVGPRPEMPFVVERYDDTQLQRLTVKPGLTGLWQISADRAFKIHDNMHYDLYYVDHRSPVMDLAICILTPFMLLPRGRGK